MTRRTVLRYLGAYLATAVLAVPVGWALAQREAAPPVAVDGRFLVDGAIFDNLPVGTMAATGEGEIIAVDVTAQFETPVRIERGRRPRSRKLRARVRTIVVGDDVPRPRYRNTMIRSMLLGSRDTTEAAKQYARVAVSPEISHISLTAFKHLDEAREVGRKATEEALATAPDFVASVRADA
jgi:predicted acylesterase/phospholipase RssA